VVTKIASFEPKNSDLNSRPGVDGQSSQPPSKGIRAVGGDVLPNDERHILNIITLDKYCKRAKSPRFDHLSTAGFGVPARSPPWGSVFQMTEVLPRLVADPRRARA
jgi:hypothetical protein